MKKMKIWAAVILAAIAFPLCATAEAGDLRLGLRIPVGVYGWTPLDDDWADTIAGAAGIRTGAEVFPLGGGRGYSDRGFFLSGRACAGYRLGLGDKNTYNARLHSLTAEFVLLARLNFTRQQGLKGGFGVQNTIGVSHSSDGKFHVKFNGVEETTFTDPAAPIIPKGTTGCIVAISDSEGFPQKFVEVSFSE